MPVMSHSSVQILRAWAVQMVDAGTETQSPALRLTLVDRPPHCAPLTHERGFTSWIVTIAHGTLVSCSCTAKTGGS